MGSQYKIVASVIIPVYNGMKTLPLQLESLSLQKGAPYFEVIIADNGSTDGLEDWISHLTFDSFAIRYLDASGFRGAAYARNYATARAQSQLLLFCDADDLVDESWVASAIRALKQYPVVTGAVYTVFETEFNKIKFAQEGWKKFPALNINTYSKAKMGSLAPVLLGGNFAIRKDYFLKIGGFDTHFSAGSEDNDLSYRIYKDGVELVVADDLRILYRIRDDWKKLTFRGYTTGFTFSQLAAKHDAWQEAAPYHKLSLASAPKTLVKFFLNFRPNDVEGNISRFSNFLTVVGLLVGRFKYKTLGKELKFSEGAGL
ncbi:glycosyltransferase family 2 protein [Rothia sp. P5764]|uniref:glycosyltransferase family 2 protein n=1 Tax=Rothia sp. P5764 TaxID=3402654 RepID=UPI003ACDF16B